MASTSVVNNESTVSSAGDWELLDSHEVFIELQGVTDLPADITTTQCSLIKPDSERPLLKVREFVYAGRYDDTVGTHLAFRIIDTNKVASGSASRDPNGASTIDSADLDGHHRTEGDKKLQYIGKTDKLLRMTPASVRSKATSKSHHDDGGSGKCHKTSDSSTPA